MNFRFLLLIACILILFSSCSNHIYAPALYHQDIAYQPKPASYDTAKSATYISAGLNYYTDPSWQNMLVSGQFNLSRGHVFNHVNLAYGAFGILGDYEKDTGDGLPQERFTDKFFGAAGARASINLFTNYERMDFRYLGIEAAYSHEFGDYADFRRNISNLPGYHVDARTELMTVGLTSEVIFHNIRNPHISNGIRVFIGGTFGDNAFSRKYFSHKYLQPAFLATVFPKISYFLKFNQCFATIEAGQQVFLRFGYGF